MYIATVLLARRLKMIPLLPRTTRVIVSQPCSHRCKRYNARSCVVPSREYQYPGCLRSFLDHYSFGWCTATYHTGEVQALDNQRFEAY